MKIRFLGLLVPAVLSGCVSQLDTKDQPATLYIDGLIADSAATISHAQTELNQTGPAPVRPVSPVARMNHVQSSAVRSPTPRTGPLLSHVVYSGRPGALNFPPRAGYVRNITVAQAAQRIVPTGWRVSWSPGTESRQRQRVNISMNDQWPRVLNNLMTEKSLYATVDWSESRVTVSTYNSRPVFGGK